MIGRSLSILFKVFVMRFKLTAFKCSDAVPSIIPVKVTGEEEDDDKAYVEVKLLDMILSPVSIYAPLDTISRTHCYGSSFYFVDLTFYLALVYLIPVRYHNHPSNRPHLNHVHVHSSPSLTSLQPCTQHACMSAIIYPIGQAAVGISKCLLTYLLYYYSCNSNTRLLAAVDVQLGKYYLP